MCKAVLFDFDGVIVDSVNIVATVESELLKKFKISCTPQEITENYGGAGDKLFFQSIVDKYPLKATIEDLRKTKELMLKAKFSQIKPIEGAIHLIKFLSENDFKLAIASGSPHYFLSMVLEAFKILEYFQAIISVDDVPRGKPHPDIFLKAAESLKVAPQEAIVIEDSVKGMIAAKAAGMKCIGLVADAGTKNYPADILVKSLTELELNDFVNI